MASDFTAPFTSEQPDHQDAMDMDQASPLEFSQTTVCGMSCPTCQSQGLTGSCVESQGHSSLHKCNRGHQWGATVPGPHS
jgi:hypothetical protein